MKFDWDPEKNIINKFKHKISFEDVEEVFEDTGAVTIYDEEHSQDEERFIVIGFDVRSRILSVCHCYRGKDSDIIRIISARMANKMEIQLYKEVNNTI